MRKELLDCLSRRLGKVVTETTVIALRASVYACSPQFVWVAKLDDEALCKVLEDEGAG